MYQILANISPKESPQEFLIRALTIRQKIVFASKETDSKIKYDATLVQGLFLHDLETGLVDETIRAKMRALLKNESVADEELIEAMSSATAAESERTTKFSLTGRGKPSPKVSKVEVGNASKPTETPGKFENEMLATLKAIQAELSTVQSEVASLCTKVDEKGPTSRQPETGNSPSNADRGSHAEKNDHYRGREPRLCTTCQEENKFIVFTVLNVEVETTWPDTERQETRGGYRTGTADSLIKSENVPPMQ